ncbi:scabin-related ADP-ribosyltransferase [Yokenella regensburgei]
MKSFISIVLSSSLFISSSSFAWANDVPNTGVLYRVDTRSPDEIFAIGFRSFGGNDSIRDHSRGVSCVGRNENSAFISTSSDPEYAGNYARRLYSQTSAPVYVYIITSRSNFYNMALSLENSGYTAGIGNARTQSEWIAYNSIPNTTIRGVRTYTGSSTPPVVCSGQKFQIWRRISQVIG